MTANEIAGVGVELAEFLGEFRDCFGRAETRGKLETYLRGQLSQLPRKSIEPIALEAGIAPRSLQEFLASDVWDEDLLRDHVAQMITRDHADEQSTRRVGKGDQRVQYLVRRRQVPLVSIAGRLHRRHDTKGDAMIFDYLDENHAITNAMFRRRLAGYKELGYRIELPPDGVSTWFEAKANQAGGVE